MEDRNEKRPLASLVVLTCNRNTMVLELLYDLCRQTVIDDVEIVVVDNGSSDGTSDRIRSAFPHVKLVKLPENIGCGGRNHGIASAAADLVITLDDDVFLHRGDEIERILECFSKHPDIDAVNFKILFPHNKELIPFNWFHPRSPIVYQNQFFETDYISEGAVAFRKRVFEQVGYYPEEFFISHEGPDLALRMLDAGLVITYCGNIEVLHKCSLQQRTSWRNTYYDTRNYFWLLYRHWPVGQFLTKSAFRLTTALVFAVSRGQLLWYFRAVKDALVGLPGQHRRRKPLQRKTRERLKEIRRLQPPYLTRLRNYLLKVGSQNQQY